MFVFLQVTLLGPVGCGHAVKSINNALLAANVISVGEALSVLVKRGIPVERALAAINTSSGRSLVSAERYPKHVINRKFDFGCVYLPLCVFSVIDVDTNILTHTCSVTYTCIIIKSF